MKINFKNPQTGKPSTVVLADHWVKVYLKVMESSWQDHDQPDHKREAITHMITCCADRYFDPTTNNQEPLTEFGLCPKDCTFTTYLETYMAQMVYSRYLLAIRK